MKPLFLRSDVDWRVPAGADLTPAAPRRFSGVAYSGGLVPRWGDAMVVDLASLKIAPSLPLLHLHSHDAIVGRVSMLENDGRQVRDQGELFTDLEPAAKKIADLSDRGIVYQQSLGLYDYDLEEVAFGKQVEVNGQTFSGPLSVLRRGTVREISIVPLGADSATSTTILQAREDRIMPAAPAQIEELTAAQSRLTELTAELNGLKQVKSDLTARAEKAEGKVTELTAELNDLKQALKDARAADVKALFSALGREHTEAAAAPYLEMTAAVFAQVRDDLLASRRGAADPALFQERAVGDPTGDKGPSLSTHDIYAARQPRAN